MYACVDEKMKSMHEFKQKHKKLQLRNVCKGHCEVKGKVLKTWQLLHEAWKLQMKAAELSSENIKKMEAVTAEWFAYIFFSKIYSSYCELYFDPYNDIRAQHLSLILCTEPASKWTGRAQ